MAYDAHDYFKSHGRDKNLLEIAVAELEFLKLVDKHPLLYEGPVLDNAIRRYECFWLPLLAKESKGGKERGKNRDDFSLLTAPLDVAWVWHLHMLSPLAYKRDCESMFGGLLDSEYLARNHSVGRNVWQQSYPDEPFELDVSIAPSCVQQYKSQLKYDLRSAAVRQSKFYYNVSLPHYRDPQFLTDAVERYKHHLNLKKANPRTFMVPCYDFDLIWHAHQLCPEKYLEDSTAILGYVLNHDDTESGRVPGSKLYESEVLTRVAWKEAGLEFSKRGAMHRGEPLPNGPPRPPGIFKSLATLDCKVDLMKIDAHLNPMKTFIIKIYHNESELGRFLLSKETNSIGSLKFPLRAIKLNSAETTVLTASLSKRKWFGKIVVEQVETNLKEFRNGLEDANQGFPAQYTTTVSFKEGPVKLLFQCASPPVMGDFKFEVLPGLNVIEVGHVAQVLSQPRLMLSQKSIELASLPGEMTTNEIKDHRGQVAFTCKIVHSVSCMLSAVEILDGDNNLAASAHCLDIGALPEVNEVSDEGMDSNCVTVAGRDGARAMLVRSRNQDYGICVGKWIKKKLKNLQGRRKTISFVGIKYYNLNEGAQGWCKVKKLKNSKFLLVLRPSTSSQVQVKVDLNGRITVPADGAEDIPQCLAVAFAVSVLHLLCRPYAPKEDQIAAPLSGKKTVSKDATEGDPRSIPCTRVRRRSLSDGHFILCGSPIMMIAAGYLCMTVPTNIYLMSLAASGGLGWGFRPKKFDLREMGVLDIEGEWNNSIGFYERGDGWEHNRSAAVTGDTSNFDWGDGGVHDGDLGGVFGGFAFGGIGVGGTCVGGECGGEGGGGGCVAVPNNGGAVSHGGGGGGF